MASSTSQQNGMAVAVQSGLLLSALLIQFVVGSKKLVGVSMEPTLAQESRIYYEKISSQLNMLELDNIIVFNPPLEFYRRASGMEEVEFAVKKIVAMKSEEGRGSPV